MRRNKDLEREYEKYRKRIQKSEWNPNWNKFLEAQLNDLHKDRSPTACRRLEASGPSIRRPSPAPRKRHDHEHSKTSSEEDEKTKKPKLPNSSNGMGRLPAFSSLTPKSITHVKVDHFKVISENGLEPVLESEAGVSRPLEDTRKKESGSSNCLSGSGQESSGKQQEKQLQPYNSLNDLSATLQNKIAKKTDKFGKENVIVEVKERMESSSQFEVASSSQGMNNLDLRPLRSPTLVSNLVSSSFDVPVNQLSGKSDVQKGESLSMQRKMKRNSNRIRLSFFVEDATSRRGPYLVSLTPETKVAELKKKVEKELAINVENQKWFLGQEVASDDNRTVHSYIGVQEDKTACFLYVVKGNSSSRCNAQVETTATVDRHVAKVLEQAAGTSSVKFVAKDVQQKCSLQKIPFGVTENEILENLAVSGSSNPDLLPVERVSESLNSSELNYDHFLRNNGTTEPDLQLGQNPSLFVKEGPALKPRTENQSVMSQIFQTGQTHVDSADDLKDDKLEFKGLGHRTQMNKQLINGHEDQTKTATGVKNEIKMRTEKLKQMEENESKLNDFLKAGKPKQEKQQSNSIEAKSDQTIENGLVKNGGSENEWALTGESTKQNRILDSKNDSEMNQRDKISNNLANYKAKVDELDKKLKDVMHVSSQRRLEVFEAQAVESPEEKNDFDFKRLVKKDVSSEEKMDKSLPTIFEAIICNGTDTVSNKLLKNNTTNGNKNAVVVKEVESGPIFFQALVSTKSILTPRQSVFIPDTDSNRSHTMTSMDVFAKSSVPKLDSVSKLPLRNLSDIRTQSPVIPPPILPRFLNSLEGGSTKLQSISKAPLAPRPFVPEHAKNLEIGGGVTPHHESDNQSRTIVNYSASQLKSYSPVIPHSPERSQEGRQELQSPGANMLVPSSSDKKDTASKQTTDIRPQSPSCVKDRLYEFISLDRKGVIPNSEDFECPVCFGEIGKNEGVVLRDCLHTFCRECLVHAVQFTEEPQVPCPYRDDDFACPSYLQDREVRGLLKAEDYDSYLKRSLELAAAAASDSIRCNKEDCPGWCICDTKDILSFKCPVCNSNNCIQCKVIHEGMTCDEYQRSKNVDENVLKNEEYLQEMVSKGEGLPCPQCSAFLIKQKWGCDWIRCAACRTEICWVTRGPRWGPGGKGDTSGGCKCGINGVKCHRDCTYCH